MDRHRRDLTADGSWGISARLDGIEGCKTIELIDLTGSGSGAVQRELKRLASSGLVTVTRIGKQKHYQANPESPVFEELHGLVLKTVAMVEPIRQALEPLANRVVLALVYGAVAKGTDMAASDIDLLVVADQVTLEHIYSALAPVAADLDRKINPTLYTSKETAERKAVGNAFLTRVLSGEHLVLIEIEEDYWSMQPHSAEVRFLEFIPDCADNKRGSAVGTDVHDSMFRSGDCLQNFYRTHWRNRSRTWFPCHSC